MNSNWQTYKGKRVFLADYSHLTIEQVRTEVVEVEKELVKQLRNSVLLLVKVERTIISPEALNLFKNVALHTQPYVRKSAILGMTGVRRTFIDIVAKFSGMTVMAFETEAQANDWLAKD
jgi:hypothetical protein